MRTSQSTRRRSASAALKKYNAERYGSLEVGPTGDALSYDVYARRAQGDPRRRRRPEPLGNLTPDITNVTASAAPRSRAVALVTYYNKIAPLQEIADDYLLTVCTDSDPRRPARKGPAGDHRIRKQKPTDRGGIPDQPEPPPLGGRRRLARAVHAAANWGRADRTRRGPAESRLHENAGPLDGRSGRISVNAGTERARSDGQKAGRRRRPCRAANTSTRKRSSATASASRSADCACRKSKCRRSSTWPKTAPHAAPNPYPDSAFCTLLGQHQPFSEETLNSLYANYGEYVEKVEADTENWWAKGSCCPKARSVSSTRPKSCRGCARPRRRSAELAEHRHLPAQLAWPGAVAPGNAGAEIRRNASDVRSAAPQRRRRMETVASGLSVGRATRSPRAKRDAGATACAARRSSRRTDRTGRNDRQPVVAGVERRRRRQNAADCRNQLSGVSDRSARAASSRRSPRLTNRA